MSHPPSELRRWAWPHLPLLVLTGLTAWLAGISMTGAEGTADLSKLPELDAVLEGAWYPLGMLAILVSHELGHYLQCRRHGVDASPPYFVPGLPIPGLGVLPFIGTFGAFIRMDMRPLKAKQLLEIGAWGPLAGWLVTIPVLFLGFSFSEVRPLPADLSETQFLGDSVLLIAAQKLFFGAIPAGHDVFLHPLAMAGWTGCLLTALNLLPAGQLDGGHVAYTMFGERFNRVAPGAIVVLVVLGIFGFTGWLVFAALVGFLGVRHPPICEDEVRGKDAWLAVASVVMFATTFTPAPLHGASLLHVLGVW